MKKKLLCMLLAAQLININVFAAEFEWAKEAVDYCVEKQILSGMEDGDLALGDNLTREQMAKMLCDAFGIDASIHRAPVFSDIEDMRWSYGYIGAISQYMFGGSELPVNAEPTEKVSREEFCATMVLVYGMTAANLRNPSILDYNFTDAKNVDSKYKKFVSIAVERGLMSGDSGKLLPKEPLTRAEACSFLYRALSARDGSLTIQPSELGVIQSKTPMVGESAVSLEQAKEWARARGATEAFIAAADIYWKYGEITGIRPDILYAQAAKETGSGKYGGAVLPEQNNFAGIKKYGATGDATEDHESFETPDDGVRAHFNHMSAYLGLEPVGETHGRYQSVVSMPWAGSVKYLEELGGKWCPDLYYGFSILHDYVETMQK